MLRRPFEFTLGALIGMMNHAGWAALVKRQVERLEDQFSAQMGRHRPADDPAAEDIHHHRQVEKAGPGRDVSDIRDPQSIGTLGDEVTLHQIGCRTGAAVADRGANPLAPADADQAGVVRNFVFLKPVVDERSSCVSNCVSTV